MSDADLLRAAFKMSASALKAAGLRFALGGGYALWTQGAPEPSHDVDLVVAEPDADRAAQLLESAGFVIERPPEDWLVKARTDGAVVDVLHRLNGVPVTSDQLDVAAEQEVLGMHIPVLPPTDVMITKLQALSEHYCDFGALLPPVRAVREQLDWQRLRDATAANDFAVAFVFLADRLGLTA
jgi:putative nucleotidyltransferase-like protein